jgi:hypothetical protein
VDGNGGYSVKLHVRGVCLFGDILPFTSWIPRFKILVGTDVESSDCCRLVWGERNDMDHVRGRIGGVPSLLEMP